MIFGGIVKNPDQPVKQRVGAVPAVHVVAGWERDSALLDRVTHADV